VKRPYFRKAGERGVSSFGWLHSKHSFSFGHYSDPEHMGFSVLRVINDDVVAPKAGFDTHGHRDMEIISYVLEGAMEHRDNMGNQGVIRAGDIQRISAGTGITHSECNHSEKNVLKFLQIWIEPRVPGIEPSYDQKTIVQKDSMTPVITPDGLGDSMEINQDVSVYRVLLNEGEGLTLNTYERSGYLHIIDGAGKLSGVNVSSGDGVGSMNEDLKLETMNQPLSALWFDLPAIC
jgi:redox-sensitive bicupin YhaK (pirin superfamily)